MFRSRAAHEETIAATTVHELSHALWEKLEEEYLDEKWIETKSFSAEELQKYTLLIEGFAVYAERVWFIDFYPLSVKKLVKSFRFKPDSVYLRGLRQIKLLVQQHGAEIFLKIPKQWRTLECTEDSTGVPE